RGAGRPSPCLSGSPALGRGEKVLQRDVQECRASLGERLGPLSQSRAHVDSASARRLQLGPKEQLRVDRDGVAVADEDPCRHRGKPVPRRKEPARLVERRRHEPPVDDAGAGLMPFVDVRVRLVLLDPLALRQRAAQAGAACASPGPAQRIGSSHAWAYGNVVPPPTVPTSSPGRRSAQWIPPSTRRPVPCAIELVPTMPRSCPVAAKIAAIAEAGVNATDCMPDATAPCVPANERSRRSSTVVRSTRRTVSSVSVASARTV